jgi:hypothetical protein
MNRRKFLKLCGSAAYGLTFGFGTTGCAIPPKDINWATVPDSKFSLEKFDDWFITHKLYNGLNPYLKMSQAGHFPTFKQCVISAGIPSLATPGIDYNSNRMYAAADGIVREVGDLARFGYGRPTGNYLQIAHCDPDKSPWAGDTFITHYAHLNQIELKLGDTVKRGDYIATSFSTSIAKLMISFGINYIDPDNYGLNHSYMNYWDGITIYGNENISSKRDKQIEIWKTINSHVYPDKGVTQYKLLRSRHRPICQDITCSWDNVEIMRYLEELYKARPQYFSKLPLEKFTELKNDFYANQPIILTLPLKA